MVIDYFDVMVWKMVRNMTHNDELLILRGALIVKAMLVEEFLVFFVFFSRFMFLCTCVQYMLVSILMFSTFRRKNPQHESLQFGPHRV